MAFPLTDIRLAIRGRTTDEPTVHPRLIRDRSILPKLDIVIQHFESMLGQERRAFDPEVLVQFLGDHKMARSVVTCLGRSYTFHTPTLAEELSPAELERLIGRRLGSPIALRLHLFDFANDFGSGFLHPAERQSEMGLLAEDLDLPVTTLERLMVLDAPERAVLQRRGPVPRPEDISAQFNTMTLLSLIRHSSETRFVIDNDDSDVLEFLKRLSQSNDVELGCTMGTSGLRVTLVGRQDALGNWGRHGHRLARMLLQILQRGQDHVSNVEADLVLKQRRGTLRLNRDLETMLRGPGPAEIAWHDDLEVSPAELRNLLQIPDGSVERCVIRRWPEPQAWQAGVMVPDAEMIVGAERRLVTVIRNASHAEQIRMLAPRAAMGPRLLLVGSTQAVERLKDIGDPGRVELIAA